MLNMSVADESGQWSARRDPWAFFPLARMSPLVFLVLFQFLPINLAPGRQSCTCEGWLAEQLSPTSPPLCGRADQHLLHCSLAAFATL